MCANIIYNIARKDSFHFIGRGLLQLIREMYIGSKIKP